MSEHPKIEKKPFTFGDAELVQIVSNDIIELALDLVDNYYDTIEKIAGEDLRDPMYFIEKRVEAEIAERNIVFDRILQMLIDLQKTELSAALKKFLEKGK